MPAQTQLTIEITTGHCLGGVGNDVYPGQLLVAPKDLSIADAWKKVRQGYARIVPNAVESGPAPESSPPGPPPVTHGDPVVADRDPEFQAPDAARRGRSQGSHPARSGGR
jgi:hypothetical protein